MTEPKSRLQKYSAPALEKGLDILELLSLTSGRGLTHAEIGEGIGRSKNEIFRMMVVLEERGYIRRTDGDVFRLTGKLDDMTGPRNDTTRMLEVAQPFMASLSRQTSLSNHLWVLKDNRMQVASRSRASDNYSLALAEGAQGPVFGSSAGACFLSALPDAAARIGLLRDMGEYVSEDDYAAFDAQVRTCAAEGVSVLPNRDAAGVIEVSAPLEAQETGQVVGVLTVPMIETRDCGNEVAAIVEHLKNTVQQICSRMALLAVHHSPC